MLPVIETAHELGYYAITCDYLPDNIAHKFSDEYHNVSIIDKEAILKLAEELKIDGVMSFACDPGVVTAAYVAEQLGLPFQGPYESVRILQDKGLFRKFLSEHGFSCPKAGSYNTFERALEEIHSFNMPVVVKPVDSAGSKGVSKVNSVGDLASAVETALQNSHGHQFIVEEFVEADGFQSSTDCFTMDGILNYCIFSDQLFDAETSNPFVPILIVWPGTMQLNHQKSLNDELQRLMTLLNMRTGIYNIEVRVSKSGKPYIMEVSPRGGGSKIADIQFLATGIDLIKAELQNAVGDPVEAFSEICYDGVWCAYTIHNSNNQAGIFRELEIDLEIKKKYVRLIDMEVKPGDVIGPFTGANKSLGDMFLRFDSREELDDVMQRVPEWLHIVLES